MADPKVSVVIPTYNRAHLIGLTLESIQRQGYRDYELVVIDDGSTDDTGKVVAERGPEARYVWQENVGIPEAINVCVRAARGEYVSFVGSDDALLPGALERQAAVLDANPNVGMVHGAAWLMDEEGHLTKVLRPPFAKGDYIHTGAEERALLLMSNHIVAPTVMVRRKCFDDAGFFDLRLGLYEDWNMWNRILKHWDIGYIDEPVTCYRVHAGEAGSIFRTADPRELARFRRTCLEEAMAAIDPATRKKLWRAAWARQHYTVALQAFYKGDGWYGRESALRAVAASPLSATGRAAAMLLARHSTPGFLVDAVRRLKKPGKPEAAPRKNPSMTVEAAMRGSHDQGQEALS